MESRELEEDEIARLNAIGFPWKVQKQEKKKILIDGRLAELWDEEKNGSVELAKKYNNYWWKCPNCGCEWQRALWIAAESNLCPACEGGLTLAKGWNDLKTVYPDIAADWDYEKNGGLKPSDVMARSGKKVWWKCRTCHGSWQCEVSYRVQDKKVGSVRPELTFSTFSSRDDNARERFELLPGISLFRWFERGQNRQSTLV